MRKIIGVQLFGQICMEEIVFKICFKDFIVLQISTEANQESSLYCRLFFRILFLVDFYPIICIIL